MERTGCYAAIRKNGTREWLDLRTIAPFVSETEKAATKINAVSAKWAAANPVIRLSRVSIAEAFIKPVAAGKAA